MTTIIAVKRDGMVVMGGDGQVTLGSSVLKHGAKRSERSTTAVCWWGFAGSAAMVLL
jgi:ATP-dependent protease HslVU (ClpYQ), peptidase subunit